MVHELKISSLTPSGFLQTGLVLLAFRKLNEDEEGSGVESPEELDEEKVGDDLGFDEGTGDGTEL